jgi:hypothetical protein
MKHLDLNTIKLPVIIREPIEAVIRKLVRHRMITENTAPMNIWFKSQLKKDNGRSELSLRFYNYLIGDKKFKN